MARTDVATGYGFVLQPVSSDGGETVSAEHRRDDEREPRVSVAVPAVDVLTPTLDRPHIQPDPSAFSHFDQFRVARGEYPAHARVWLRVADGSLRRVAAGVAQPSYTRPTPAATARRPRVQLVRIELARIGGVLTSSAGRPDATRPATTAAAATTTTAAAAGADVQ